MKIVQAIANFMDHQKMNAGKKYDQELRIIPEQIQIPVR